MSAKPAETLHSAGLFRRLAALLYDSLVVTGIAFVVTNVYLTIYHLVFGLGQKALNPIILQSTLFPCILLGTALFFLWFWTHGGRTGTKTPSLCTPVDVTSGPGLPKLLYRSSRLQLA
jgi:uncharacterized RDD family membrane protein YckC